MPELNTNNGLDIALSDEISIEELAELQPVDIAEYLAELPVAKAAKVLTELPIDVAQATVATRLFPNLPDLFLALPNERAVEIIRNLRTDERVYLFRQLYLAKGEKAEQLNKKLFSQLPEDMQTELQNFLRYPLTSIASMMTTEFTAVYADMTVEMAKKLVLRQQRLSRKREIYDIYVLERDDGEKRLVGVVSLRDLLLADDLDTVEDIMQRDPISILPTEERWEAAVLVSKYNLLSLPVVTHDNRMLGIVTVDDIIDVIVQEETRDYLKLGGVQTSATDKPYFETPIWTNVRKRLTWLLLLFVGGTLTANVLEGFKAEIEKVVVLTIFIPLLIGTGGNAGSQTVSTVIRSLTISEIKPQDWLKVLFKELSTGLALGLLLCGIASIFAMFRIGNWHLAITVGLSVVAICTWANIIGALIPIAAESLGHDPTVLSAPLITTLVDATGLIIYFTVAKLVLGL
jgi:magnesium transporter